MTDDERDALLVRLDDRTARITKQLDGNGRQGLIADVAQLKTEVQTIRRDTPRKKEKVAVASGITIACITALSSVIVAVISSGG